MFQKTVSFKFCLIHVHVKRLGVKFPWDLHWGYKTHKLNRSILSTLVKNHCINEQGRLAQCNQVTVTFAGHGEKVEATSLELKTLREGCYQNEERGTGNGERENGNWEKRNLTWTLALSVTSFPILWFVPIFFFPIPRTCSPVPFPRSSNIPPGAFMN